MQNLSYLIIHYTITYEIYYYDAVAADIANLPMPLGVLYVALTQRMQNVGGNLGMPHTKAVDKGLFIMLHTFMKKTRKIPKKELNIAKQRLNEVKQNEKP